MRYEIMKVPVVICLVMVLGLFHTGRARAVTAQPRPGADTTESRKADTLPGELVLRGQLSSWAGAGIRSVSAGMRYIPQFGFRIGDPPGSRGLRVEGEVAGNI